MFAFQLLFTASTLVTCRAQPASAGSGIVPAVLRAMYNIGNVQSTNANNRQAAMGFDQQYIKPSDVEVCAHCSMHSP